MLFQSTFRANVSNMMMFASDMVALSMTNASHMMTYAAEVMRASTNQP